MTTTKQRTNETLDRIDKGLTELLAQRPALELEQHFHGPAARWEDAKNAGAELHPFGRGPDVSHPLARIAVLAVSLNLKNRLDAKRVIEGSEVLDVISAYGQVQELRQLLGAVTDEELEAATALYDELAS